MTLKFLFSLLFLMPVICYAQQVEDTLSLIEKIKNEIDRKINDSTILPSIKEIKTTYDNKIIKCYKSKSSNHLLKVIQHSESYGIYKLSVTKTCYFHEGKPIIYLEFQSTIEGVSEDFELYFSNGRVMQSRVIKDRLNLTDLEFVQTYATYVFEIASQCFDEK